MLRAWPVATVEQTWRVHHVGGISNTRANVVSGWMVLAFNLWPCQDSSLQYCGLKASTKYVSNIARVQYIETRKQVSWHCKYNQLVHNFFLFVYLYFLHVSGNYVHIIRRNYCINATLGICHSVWMTDWFAGWGSYIPDSHPHRVANTRCRIDTVISPDDGHIVGRNM